jgi:hypothetical protein
VKGKKVRLLQGPHVQPRKTPVAKDLKGILEACQRHITNKNLEIADLIDNDDAEPGEMETMIQTRKNWQELADDIEAIIKSQK